MWECYYCGCKNKHGWWRCDFCNAPRKEPRFYGTPGYDPGDDISDMPYFPGGNTLTCEVYKPLPKRYYY